MTYANAKGGALWGAAFETVEKACHCEPVRAAKQAPLGYSSE